MFLWVLMSFFVVVKFWDVIRIFLWFVFGRYVVNGIGLFLVKKVFILLVLLRMSSYGL